MKQPVDTLTTTQTTFVSIVVSRVPLDQEPKTGELQLWPLPQSDQLAELYEGVVPFFSDYANYDERLLNSYLSLLVQG